MNVIRQWVQSDSVNHEHSSLPILQVYVWIKTTDKKIIIVSKDGENWQFPGGHPEEGETLLETAKRETYEETGISIDIDGLTFFGYYKIVEEDETEKKEYLQTRFFYQLDKSSAELNLMTQERVEEAEQEKIKFIEAVDLEEATKRISWLSSTDEYKYFASSLA